MTPGHPDVELRGDIDAATAAQQRAICLAALAGTDRDRFVIDMAAVRFVDSSGITALLDIHEAARVRGIRIWLTGTREHTQKVLQMLDLLEELPTVPELQ